MYRSRNTHSAAWKLMRAVCSGFFAALALSSGIGALAQSNSAATVMPPVSAPAGSASSAKTAPPSASGKGQSGQSGQSGQLSQSSQAKAMTQPEWARLTEEQRAAVRPLYADWAYMPANQKRKWIELTASFGSMSPEEKAKVHARMASWSNLSPQQRVQARLNFADAAGSTNPEERRAKWQAYQQLSPEEKQRLRIAGKVEQPKGAALAPRPAASDRFASLPKAAGSAARLSQVGASKQTPKIAVSPQAVASATP